ncbi:hypothetical protein Hanom_Chr17g01584851 [Helianthus anomalus]
MADEFLNPFSDVFAFNSIGATSFDANLKTTTKAISDLLRVDNAYGTYNKLTKLMAIEDYNH